MTNCKDCKHWTAETDRRTRNFRDCAGTCWLIGQHEHAPPPRIESDSDENALMAYLVTPSDFGCVLGEPRE